MSIQPGVHDISNDEYHASAGISRSAIMEFKKTPFHYWNEYLNPERPPKPAATPALSFGNALHTYILEPNEFSNRYLVAAKIKRTTKEGKKYWAELQAARGNREIIFEKDFMQVERIAQSVHDNEQARELVSGAQYEKSIYWNDPHTGLLCKARPDIWHTNMICDLKSTLDASSREFQRSLWQYGYHIQAGMIHEALKHTLGVEITKFIFIALEKEYPYAHAVYRLDELAVEQGVIEFKNKLVEMKECIESNVWPSYKTQVITLPAYANFGE